MQESNTQRRTSFAVNLLYDLKEIYSRLDEASRDIEKCSGSFYEKMFLAGKTEIRDELDKYNANIEKIKKLNQEITEAINAWYEFTKSGHELKKLFFPLRFFIRKMQLKKNIKKLNEGISGATIANRFVREYLINWEHELELEAVQEIKQGSEYTAYEDLVNKKDMLITELKYLLPTIPGICPAELDLRNIDSLIERLLKLPAA